MGLRLAVTPDSTPRNEYSGGHLEQGGDSSTPLLSAGIFKALGQAGRLLWKGCAFPDSTSPLYGVYAAEGKL